MSLMEKFLPHCQFVERHQTTVPCRPGDLLDIIQSFEPPPDRVTDIALYLRQLPARIIHWVAPSHVPLPKPFTAANFTPLGRDGDREIVGGLVGKFWQFWRADFGLLVVQGPVEFLACNPPKRPSLRSDFWPNKTERLPSSPQKRGCIVRIATR